MLVAALALGLAAAPAPRTSAATGAVDLTLAQLRALIGQPEQAAADGLAVGYSLACAPPAAAAGQVEVSCRFARMLGRTAIHPDFELAGRIPIRELRLKVEDGRIAGLSFRTSVDSYDAVQDLLAKVYGPPKLTRGVIHTELGSRDQVKLVWSGAGHAARVVDPAPPDLGLMVDLGG